MDVVFYQSMVLPDFAGKETLDQAVSGVESDISLMLQEQAW